MYDDPELSPEEHNLRYLHENPGYASSLWADWVITVCNQQKIPNPTQKEWEQLRANWYVEKAPIDSVSELKRFRAQATAQKVVDDEIMQEMKTMRERIIQKLSQEELEYVHFLSLTEIKNKKKEALKKV